LDTPNGNQTDSHETEAQEAGHTSRHRLIGLTDGVFSIAMTLLVIDVKVEKGTKLAWDIFPALLISLEGYLLSFLVLGAYWVAHHNLFQHIERTDRSFLWINILFLACIAFIPFGANLIGSHGREQISVFIYGGILVVSSMATDLMYWYALKDNRLVAPTHDPGVTKVALRRVLLPIVVYLLAIGVSFFSIRFSIALFVIVPILFIIPTKTDKYWQRLPSGKKEEE
jgi:uncharacterized membrane protein